MERHHPFHLFNDCAGDWRGEDRLQASPLYWCTSILTEYILVGIARFQTGGHPVKPGVSGDVLMRLRSSSCTLRVQGWVGGARHGGHGVGDHRAVVVVVVVQEQGEEGQAPGPGPGLHGLLHRPKLRGLGRRPEPGLQQRLLRVPRRLALRRPLLLLPRRPSLPPQRHQLPHLRPKLRPLRPVPRRRRARGASDAVGARQPDAPLLRRQHQGHLRGRGVAQDPARRLGGRRRRRRHRRLRHQPHGAGQAGLPRRRGRARQEARPLPARRHGPLRVLLQLDLAVAQGRRRRPAKAGRALRRVGAAGAAVQELRDRRGARRQVHRRAGGAMARDLRHRQHLAAGAPLGVRPQEPTAQIQEVAVHALVIMGVQRGSLQPLVLFFFFSLWWWWSALAD
ncbi:ribose import ATP-binding protein RbsA 1 isoform X2 [Brachypodium distachyon]|uniref:ribose import ATP-binding protein RbsA 1 isoform X2 n=1 Tax=Brachypodium distachyon TaxID=15368 RepID=UPI00071D88BD|nr:ribose import ATP-binding protein RbsA 1 isoform X2 [Brachypodium distachyon]|eukprot:XP_014753587.1 ribose import ATP-binding protein RbsA 1 isoform X2 [Brachypodium distachyon]